MRTLMLLTLSCMVFLQASTGLIQGTIASIAEKGFVITGVDRSKKKAEETRGDHKIPGSGKPIFILDGKLSTREATLKVGRQCFVFWNRHTQQMVVALSGDEAAPEVSAPVPSGDQQHSKAGVIVSGDPEAETVVLRTANGKEVTVHSKKGKTRYILGTDFGSTFEETIVPGRRAVAFCYRNREYPNFVVAFEAGADAEETAEGDQPAESASE